MKGSDHSDIHLGFVVVFVVVFVGVWGGKGGGAGGGEYFSFLSTQKSFCPTLMNEISVFRKALNRVE